MNEFYDVTLDEHPSWEFVDEKEDGIPSTEESAAAAGGKTESTPQEPEQSSFEMAYGAFQTAYQASGLVAVKVVDTAATATEGCMKTAQDALAAAPKDLQDGVSAATGTVTRIAAGAVTEVALISGFRKQVVDGSWLPPCADDYNTSG